MGIDFGKNRTIIPKYYTLRNRDSNTDVLLNWHFEASIEGKKWYLLDKKIHR